MLETVPELDTDEFEAPFRVTTVEENEFGSPTLTLLMEPALIERALPATIFAFSDVPLPGVTTDVDIDKTGLTTHPYMPELT